MAGQADQFRNMMSRREREITPEEAEVPEVPQEEGADPSFQVETILRTLEELKISFPDRSEDIQNAMGIIESLLGGGAGDANALPESPEQTGLGGPLTG